MKKRFIFLICFVVLILIACTAVVIFGAKTYNDMLELPQSGLKAEDFSFCTDHDIVRVTEWHVEGDKLYYTVAPSSGETGMDMLNMTYASDEEEYWVGSYAVGWFGTLIQMDGFDFAGSKVVILLLYIAIFASLAITVWSFVEKWRRAQYSYLMIVYAGFSVFLFFMVFNALFINRDSQMSFGRFLWEMAESGSEFVSFSTPLALVFAVAVSVSNIFLMIREGFHPVNALGILFSALMIGGRAFLYANTFYITGSAAYVKWMTILYSPLNTLLAYLECMLYATVVCAYLASRHKPPCDRDYLMILGCAIRPDGSLTPLLRGRADSALRFEKEQYEKTGRHAIFVPSGGQGSDEVIAEGEAIRRYLKEQGISDEQILPETESVNTRENLTCSKAIMDRHADGAYQVAFATTNYHVFRGYVLAEKAGLHGAQGISAKTKWYFFPNAFLRELVGLIVEEKKRHIIVAGLTVLFYVALNLIVPM